MKEEDQNTFMRSWRLEEILVAYGEKKYLHLRQVIKTFDTAS